MDSPPTTLMPSSWKSISSVSELPARIIGDIKPLLSSSSSTEDPPSRRPRSAGRIGSILQVIGNDNDSKEGKGSEDEKVYLGLALLRLEVSDGEMVFKAEEQTDGITSEGHAQEAGVNATGGFTKEAGKTNDSDILNGEWKVKAFKQSLAGAKWIRRC